MSGQDIGAQLEPGERHSPLDPTIQLEQFEMELDRFGQLGMALLYRT
jgi:hypothetical protein